MSTRSDIPVDYRDSPRIAKVQSPSVAVIMQDLVDTFRIDEEGFARGLSFTKLLDASGKEALIGGLQVGITASMQDTLLAFESRRTPAETGTITTGSGPPNELGRQTFIDTAATFIANGVTRGSMVINFTDNSLADVISVDSSGSLTTETLVNGSGNTFDIGDVYHVFNVVQCTASGGNLVAVDSSGSAFTTPILPTAFTQVVLFADTSAALIDIATFQRKLEDLWRLQGLDPTNPMTVTPATRDAGSTIHQDITGDATTTTTVTRTST